jgi:hypothetical protein
MPFLKARCLFWSQLFPNFSSEGLDQEAAAHTYPAVNTPYSQRQADFFQCFPPCKHVLINAIN